MDGHRVSWPSSLNPSLRPFAAARRCGGLAKFLSCKAGNSDSTPWVPVHRHQRSVSTPAAGKLSVARRTERNTSERSSVTRPTRVFFGVLIHFFTSKFNIRFTLTPPPHHQFASFVDLFPLSHCLSPLASRRPPFSLATHSRGVLACFNTTPAVPQRTFFSHLPALSPHTTHAPPRSSVSSTHTCLFCDAHGVNRYYPPPSSRLSSLMIHMPTHRMADKLSLDTRRRGEPWTRGTAAGIGHAASLGHAAPRRALDTRQASDTRHRSRTTSLPTVLSPRSHM
jgi:hypothetical protein